MKLAASEIKKVMKCVRCYESKEAIRKHHLICGEVDHYGELIVEYRRHRFKPFTKKELEAIARDEEEMLRQMGGFADFVARQN